ncbi:MAG: M28 family peptidase, partial [Geminicoccaceae bacterium]
GRHRREAPAWVSSLSVSPLADAKVRLRACRDGIVRKLETALVANGRSRGLLARVVTTLGTLHRSLPYRALVLPTNVPGAWSSDHWSFWREGYPALMVTDTAPLRNRSYHTRQDTPDKVDFKRLDQAVNDLTAVIADLVGTSEAEPGC